ncbi:MAG TPA: hypothetical protein VH951_00665 [Dehalococcoidia bacterium]
MTSDAAALRERLRPHVETARDFTGWTFDYEPRRIGPPKPWSYSGRAREFLRDASSVLDLGTAAGERFGTLLDGYAGRAVATEEWHVNAPLAARHLHSLGGDAVRALSITLPFGDDAFDLILSRQEQLDPFEVARILTSGGSVLTQQIDDLWWFEMRDFFPRWQSFGDHFHYYAAGYIAAGLAVTDARRHLDTHAYKFEEAIKHLCRVPWYLPGFDPLGRDFDAVEALYRMTNSDGELLVTNAVYILEARKPK